MTRIRRVNKATLPLLRSKEPIEPTFSTGNPYSKIDVLSSETLLSIIFGMLADPKDKGNMSRACKFWAQKFYLDKLQYDMTLTRRSLYGRSLLIRHGFRRKVLSVKCLCYKYSNLFVKDSIHEMQEVVAPMEDGERKLVYKHHRVEEIARFIVFRPNDVIDIDD